MMLSKSTDRTSGNTAIRNTPMNYHDDAPPSAGLTMIAFALLMLATLCLVLAAGPADADGMSEDLWDAICFVESSNNPDAHHKGEDSRGIVQVRAIMVKDVNRIIGEDRYTHDDAWCVKKSREMFDIYRLHYHPNGSAERIARCWQGGPKGHLRKSEFNDGYWAKVQKAMNN